MKNAECRVQNEERRFTAALKDLRSGYLLLYRAGWRPWRWLQQQPVYSHAAMLAKEYMWPHQWQVLQMWGGRGVVSMLAAEVDRRPGRIDVFAVNPGREFASFKRHVAVGFMRAFVGVQSRVEPMTSSHAIDAACCAGGVDPVVFLDCRLVTPGDLARSSFFEYRFTLVP